jgi:preprotein translocase subunit YajC
MEFALIWLVVLAVAFFLFVVRPQRRQMAARQALIESTHVGDEIVTSGGILGTVRSVEVDTVDLEVATGVVIKVARGAIVQRVPADLPRADDAEAV